MRRFFEHLEPGGTLAMTWIDIALDYNDNIEDRFVKEAQLADGSTLRRTYRAWFDASSGLEHTDDLYERLRDGDVIDREQRFRSPATRHYARADLIAIHADAGFENVRLMSLTTAGPPDPDERAFMSVATASR